MVKRFLITTALEETWRDDVPVLFLGEWCRRYDRREKWQSLDAEVVPYHWDDRQKFDQDYRYLQNLYEELLVEVRAQLNALHCVDHSVRYWRILLGPWLGYFIQMLFDRWVMVRQAIRDYDIVGARVMWDNGRHVVPQDMESFHALFISDAWNEAICGELLVWMGVPCELASGGTGALLSPLQNNSGDRIGFKRKLKNTLARAADALSGLVCAEREFFFIASYLPTKQRILLELKLGQLPKRWRLVRVPPSLADHASREEQVVAPDDIHDFPSVARAMIQRHIPTAYREGYNSLVATTRKLPWPKFPKAIFTSNSYSADDVFKAWAAEKVETGVPLVIGQHGGNYGMARWNFAEEHQIAIADRFLTWGWSKSDQQKLIPVGNVKGFGSKVEFDKQGVALLVEMSMPRASYHLYSVPVAHQWLDYFEDQSRFVLALPPELREQLLVRLYPQDYGWCQKQRWQTRFPLIRLDDGSQPMAALFNRSRLYISTYNATTYLESLSLNIPTIMFWNPLHWELRDSAIPALEKLKSVGIFHETPESAARHMAQIWDNVDAWWQSESIQQVRREFCACYSHFPERPLERMEKIFREVAATGVPAKAARPAA